MMPQEGWQSAFMPQVWVGNDDLGLAWIAESDEWWRPHDGQMVEVLPHGATTLMRCNIIRQPLHILAAEFPPMPGVGELLESLHAAGFALAVGSSGPPENVNLVLDRLGNRGLFGSIVHGMDVTRGKPDPQVFLLAAHRLGIPAKRCAVVEDTPWESTRPRPREWQASAWRAPDGTARCSPPPILRSTPSRNSVRRRFAT